MIDRGRIALDAPADEIRGSAATVSGPAPAVKDFVAGRRIWHHQALGSRASATVAGALDDSDWARARELHLNLEPLSLQELMIHTSDASANEKVSA